jgi:hypothetical protein
MFVHVFTASSHGTLSPKHGHREPVSALTDRLEPTPVHVQHLVSLQELLMGNSSSISSADADMNPEQIIESAASMGVILWSDSGVLRFHGQIPANWIQTTAAWLPHRAAVIQWLETSISQTHRFRVAKAQLAIMKQRSKAPCRHLGIELEKRPACGCGARHECGLHGSCVLTGNTDRWRICSKCPDYSPAESA